MEYRDNNVDYKMLEAHDITWKWNQPWQLSLFYPDIQGKFVWYPERGSLISEGNRSEFGVFKIGEFTDTEDVINEIMKFL